LVLGWAVTLSVAFYFRGSLLGRHPDETARSVFLAFAGELVFFTFVGVIGTLVSLRDPKDEGFDERLKILYGRDVPNVVFGYIRNNILMKLSAYAKSGKRTITIESYDDALHAYRVRIETTYEIHNLLRDVPYNQTTTISILPDAFEDPAPRELGKMLSVKVGHSNKLTQAMHAFNDVLFLPKDGYTTNVTVELDSTTPSTTVAWVYLSWIRIHTPQALSPEWVVGELETEIISECPARVDIADDDRGVISMLHMEPVRLQRILGVSPGEKVCIYTLLPPGA